MKIDAFKVFWTNHARKRSEHNLKFWKPKKKKKELGVLFIIDLCCMFLVKCMGCFTICIEVSYLVNQEKY